MGWPKIAIVSGGFDPVHIGHVRLFKEARKFGSELWVILNNDNWLMAKKGFIFMPEQERKEILESLNCVDYVFLTEHEENPADMSVCKELEKLAKFYGDELKFDLIFCNGGDRKETNVPEYDLCEQCGITMVFGIGGEKIQSSTNLARKANNSRIVLETK
jgi:D-beta-D-heptose 7-phosphate kinase/D-beta-D-heptose 1-phosphate adenosyltransferase